MATFIHGIGASENIDSSGEIVSIAGLDVSSLDKDGVFNWEHKADVPAQVVGKILKARKIFSDADCEDDHQLAFWNKVKVPYLYVMGELFDDYSDSAREVAGKFRYDADHKNTNERNVMNFSVEGSKISKEGITVTRSIGRKITITVLACNKAAVAEMVASKAPNPKKNEVDELFKTESVEIEIFSPGPNWNLLKKEDPKKHASKLGIKPFQKDLGGGQKVDTASTGLSGTGPTSAGGVLGGEGMMRSETEMTKSAPLEKSHQRGSKIGMTSSGKEVYSHGMVGDYHGFSSQDHKEAAGHHQAMAAKVSGSDSKLGTHHGQKYTLHMQASKSAARKAKPKASPKLSIVKNAATMDMNKALEAGSALASPANLSGGAALQKESINGSVKKKSKLLQRAELEYTTWSKREEFETFMKSRMPGLTKGEIQVIGQTMLLQKSLRQEKALSKVAPSEFQHSWINKKEKLKKGVDASKTTEDPTEEAAKVAQTALSSLPQKLKNLK